MWPTWREATAGTLITTNTGPGVTQTDLGFPGTIATSNHVSQPKVAMRDLCWGLLRPGRMQSTVNLLPTLPGVCIAYTHKCTLYLQCVDLSTLVGGSGLS